MTEERIEFILNGTQVYSKKDATCRLLDVLREEFHLTGPKEGCGEGECGACSVLIDGILYNSCVTPLGNVQGKTVLTVDGFKESKRYKVLESAFADAGAVQCGYCTPAMIMAAEALLSKNAHPNLEDIREAISGNLCRCTGYNMIIDAIHLAAERGEGLW